MECHYCSEPALYGAEWHGFDPWGQQTIEDTVKACESHLARVSANPFDRDPDAVQILRTGDYVNPNNIERMIGELAPVTQS